MSGAPGLSGTFRQRPVVAAVRSELSVDSSNDRGVPVTQSVRDFDRRTAIERLEPAHGNLAAQQLRVDRSSLCLGQAINP
jgi:hypothetical protein